VWQETQRNRETRCRENAVHWRKLELTGFASAGSRPARRDRQYRSSQPSHVWILSTPGAYPGFRYGLAGERDEHAFGGSWDEEKREMSTGR